MSEIVLYKTKYQDQLLRAFESNVPEYFLANEFPIFKAFIEKAPTNYYLLIEDEKLIGGGGYVDENPTDARIVWFLIHRDFHGKDRGRRLLNHLMNEIKLCDRYEIISLMTSQLTDGFYKRCGFQTIKSEEDYWAKDFHLRYMTQEI